MEILYKPVEELGLSVDAVKHLQNLKIKNLKKVVEQSNNSCKKLKKIIVDIPVDNLYCFSTKYSEEQIKALAQQYQKYYIEIIDYLRTNNIKFIEDTTKQNNYIENIKDKIRHLNVEYDKEEQIINELAQEILGENKTIANLIEIETQIIKKIFKEKSKPKQIYSDEQIFRKISKELNIDEIRVGAIYYQALEKLRNYMHNQIIKKQKQKTISK